MKLVLNTAAAATALILVSACSGEQAAENQAQAPAGQVETASMYAMANDPSNPYTQAEMQMHERMMAAQGANASETWVRKLIEHHRGAIEMSNVLVNQGGEQPVVEKARKTAQDQRKEIQDLERMLQAGGIGAGTTGNANPYTQSEQTMHDRMMAATGANPSETWLRKMIEHHRGAVHMSNILIQQGGDPKVLEKARMTAQKQQKEIHELQRMLAGGETAAAATAPTATANSTPSKAEPRQAATSKARAEARRAAPQEAVRADPKVETAPAPEAPAKESTCTPEHRAMGHC